MEAKEFNHLLQKTHIDEKSFNKLYNFYYNRIVRHLLGRFGKEIAEDAAHTFFINLLKSDKKYEFIRKPTTWVYTCCDNLAKTMVSKKKKETPLLLDVESKPLHLIDENLADIGIAVEKLDDVSKQIIYLYYWEGYSLEEISEILNISYTAIRKRHSQIKVKIKNFLK